MKKVINTVFRRLNERILSRKHKRLTVPLQYKGKEDLRSCLLFYEDDSEMEKAIESLKRGLPKVRFQRLCFLPKSMQQSLQNDVVCFSPSDLVCMGKIANVRLTEILSEKFDLLVDFTTQSNVLTQYVLKNSEACCIIGRKGKGDLTDITLVGVNNNQDFVMQLLTLLTEIIGCENGKI